MSGIVCVPLPAWNLNLCNHESRYERSVGCVFVCRGVWSLEVDVHAGTSKAKRVSDSDMGGFAWADKRGAVVFGAKEFTASTFHLHRWALLQASVCPDMRKYCVYYVRMHLRMELFSRKVHMCVTEVSHNDPDEAQVNQSGGTFTLETVLTVAQKHTSTCFNLISSRCDSKWCEVTRDFGSEHISQEACENLPMVPSGTTKFTLNCVVKVNIVFL